MSGQIKEPYQRSHGVHKPDGLLPFGPEMASDATEIQVSTAGVLDAVR
ncbi:hypothetical protein [Spirosoma spitsbergense]|nr:hypothetical protein [Spirosoma spitsbergense]